MTTVTTDQVRCVNTATSPTQLHVPHDAEIATFRTALPRWSHARNFAVATLMAYAQSEGLCGYDSSSFRKLHGIPDVIAKGIIPPITKQLFEAGILIKNATPFDVYLGLFPSPLFIATTLTDPSILHFLSREEETPLKKLSAAITEVSQAELEKRWLLRIASAFLYIRHGDALSISHLFKLLPEFEGREERVSTLLSQLHENDLITHVKSEGVSEIFLTPALLDRLEDRTLAERLKDPRRNPEPFPFVVKHLREVQERSSADTVSRADSSERNSGKRTAQSVSPALKKALATATTTIPETGGNIAGRATRAAILDAVKSSPTALTTVHLLKQLAHLSLKEATLSYHIKLLCQDGYLTQDGKGRKATFALKPRLEC